jgi:hypothetical protein
MSGNLLVRFDEGRVGRTQVSALSPTLPREKECHGVQPRHHRAEYTIAVAASQPSA